MNAHRHNPKRREAPGARRAFTLAELLVAVAVMVLLMLAVANIFGLVQRSSSLTAANIDVLDKLRTISGVIRSDIESINKTAYLLIRTEEFPPVPQLFDTADYPYPRVTDPAATPKKTDLALARADVFAFYKSAPQQRSVMDLAELTGGSNALITYGHGLPGRVDPATNMIAAPAVLNAGLVISDWVLSRRAVLVLPSVSALSTWQVAPPAHPGVLGMNAGVSQLSESQVDVLVDSLNLLVDDVHTAAAAATDPNSLLMLWDRPKVPVAVDAATYRRACFLLAEHVGDFIVEWTDGSTVDPGLDLANPNDDVDTRTQWFGWERDANLDGAITAGSGDVFSKTRWLAQWGALPTDLIYTTFAGSIEIERTDLNSPHYCAVWTTHLGDPDYAPRAIRIILRLYDSQKRLTDARGNPGQLYTLYFDLP